MSDRLVVALDQGTHASRASAWTADGRCVAEAHVPVSLHRDGERVEQDPEELLSSLHRALQRLKRDLGPAWNRVTHAALATQRSSLLCWHRESFHPLTPVLSWQDTRAAQHLDAAGLDNVRVRELTGLRPNAHFGASKFRWCLEEVPAVQEAAAAGELRLGPLSSWLTARLTGAGVAGVNEPPVEPWVDPCNGARTLLLDRSGAWAPELLDAFRIDAAWLPRPRDNPAPRGSRLHAFDLPLDFVTGDQSAVPFGVGLGPGDVVANLGTGGFLLRRLGPADSVPGDLLETTAWREGESKVLLGEATINGCGAAVSWFAGADGSRPEKIDRWLEDSTSPALFLNTVGGLGSPDWRADLQPAFRGDGPAARAAGVLESIVFLLRRNLEILGGADRLVVTGGLARSLRLVERIAALLGHSVERCVVTEATSRGVADRLFRAEGGLPPAPRERVDPVAVPGLSTRYADWTAWLEAHSSETVDDLPPW